MEKLTTVAEIKIKYTPTKGLKPIVGSAQNAYDALKPFFPKELIAIQEQFVVMYLNRANKIIGIFRVSTGGITGTVVDTRLILGTALKIAATGLILAHNHPSGNLKASQADLILTRKLKNAAALMDIRVEDHIILSGTEDAFFSFATEGEI